MRITQKKLEKRLQYLNATTNRPETAHTKLEDGAVIQNESHLHLDVYSPGPDNPYRYKVVEMGEHGVWDFSGHGRMTARECWAWIDGFVRAIEDVRDRQ